jgi:transglutaminase-like putative cysteine protease
MRRYCEVLLLLLLAVGLLALGASGRLPAVVIAAVGVLYLLRVVGWSRHWPLRLSGRALTAAGLLYIPLFALDAMVLSGSWSDAGLHWLVIAGAIKMFSLNRGRDSLTVGLFAFLEMLAAAVLTVSGVFLLLFVIFLVLLVATLVAHEMARGEQAGRRATAPPPIVGRLLRFSLLLSLGVAGFTVLIFFLLPRTALGAWGGHRAISALSGFSDDVRLGAIASLQRTNNPVMHIRLLPPPAVAVAGSSEEDNTLLSPEQFEQVTWRGRGLTSFDGRRWYDPNTPNYYATDGGRFQVASSGTAGQARLIRYQVTLEPMASPVLFFPSRLLRAATRFPVLGWDRSTATLSSPANFAAEQQLGAGGPQLSAGGFVGTSYSGVSDLAQPSVEQLRAAAATPRRQRVGMLPYLQLPDDLDPRIRALARAIVAHARSDDYDRLATLTDYLQTHYQYTLDDLPQGRDPLAEFLFEQRAGDCEYFASALAVMARSLSIPTRVVNGFLGGVYNPLSGEYVVRGGDAHSWVEAYFPLGGDAVGRRGNRGVWISFDATPPGAAVHAGLWPNAGMVFDALSSVWQEWFVNYDWVRQANTARSLQSSLGDVANRAWENGLAAAGSAWQGLTSATRVNANGDAHPLELGGAGIVLLGGLFVGMASFRRGWRFWRPCHAPLPAHVRAARSAYSQFQRQLARSGIAVAPEHTSDELLALLNQRPGPAPFRAAAAAFVASYQAVRFGAAPVDGLDEPLRALRRARRAPAA